MGDGHVLVDLPSLMSLCSRLLAATGLELPVARLVADSLCDAEARGITSHGVQRVRIYVERIRGGLLDPHAVPTVASERQGVVILDAHNAIGHLGACRGIDLGIERAAATTSVCVVGVRNSNHCGTLAYFVRRATDRGLVALAASNAPPTMVYHGGRTRAVGTNPLAIGIPAAASGALVLDMATSATARGKIILADQIGAPIPAGWAVDEQGQPTTDTKAALRGSVLPFAGPKGSGLAMMIDLLCGGLVSGITGAGVGDMYDDWSRPQRVSHLFIVLDPAAFLGRLEFSSHVEAFVWAVKDLATADGFDSVQLPGEPEEAARRTAEASGVLVPTPVARDLAQLAKELGVADTITQPDRSHAAP